MWDDLIRILATGDAPTFSYGILPAILAGVSMAGQLFGKAGQASGQQRRDDAFLGTQMVNANNRAQLDAGQFNLQAPGLLGRRILGSSGLMNFKPRGSAGGFGQALQDPQTRAALMQLMQQSGGQLQSGSYRIKPQMAQLAKPGFMEKFSGILGTAGGLADVLSSVGLGRPKDRQQPGDGGGWD